MTALAWPAILKSQSHWLRPQLWSSPKVLKLLKLLLLFFWFVVIYGFASSNFILRGHICHHSLPSFLPFFILVTIAFFSPPLNLLFAQYMYNLTLCGLTCCPSTISSSSMLANFIFLKIMFFLVLLVFTYKAMA